MTQTLFIADLHLGVDSPKLNQKFIDNLAAWAGNIDALYILGDLFDAWVGDDENCPVIAQIKTAMAQFSQKTPLWVMHGNRDFLLGDVFSQETGAKIIADPSVVSIYGQQYVLSHGDAMCTDDLAYQAFRSQSRNAMWQQAILAKPLAERRLLAAQIRQMSETKKNDEGLSEISDVTEAGVIALWNSLANQGQGMGVLIHGHTHRPNVHEHQIGDKNITRHVIQDWHNDIAGYLALDESGSITTHPL